MKELCNRAIAPVIDLATVLGVIWGIPHAARWLEHRSWLTGAAVLAAYLAMCLGLVLLKLVRTHAESIPAAAAGPDSPGESGGGSGMLTHGCALGLSIPFCAFVLVMLLDTSGVISGEDAWLEQFRTGKVMDAVLSIMGILLFILVFGLFPWALNHTPRPRVSLFSPTGILFRILGLAGANAMILATSAYWYCQLAEGEPMGLGLSARLLVFCVTYPVFLMFYAPPRLALVSIDGDRWSLPSFLVALAAMVWPLTA
ncbi:MAG: hypothetical protein V2A76_12685 [Planctomycetota bacterium]